MFHHKNNFVIPKNIQASAIVPRLPEPFSGFETSAPVTIHNGWPEYVDNEPIYAYLLPDRTDELSCFIACTYKASCAIVYSPDDNQNNAIIIASGCLIANDTLITARHAIDKFPKDKIYIRFFTYEVSEHSANYTVHEEALDVPMINYSYAKNGLDACFIFINNKIPAHLNDKFKPKHFGVNDSSIPPTGQYIMCHFADGIHQVSTGHLSNPPYGMPLQQALILQGGPGASGASIIWYAPGFGDPAVFGISIYRQISNGNIERRIIPYCEFEATIAPTDPIKNPYTPYCLNPILTNLDPRLPGYEFKIWSDNYYGERAEHPKDPNDAYDVPPNFSNHHIIPIGHLLYLWDYLHELDDPRILQIEQQARDDTLVKCQELQQWLLDDIHTTVDYSKPPLDITRQQQNLTNICVRAQDNVINKRIQVLIENNLTQQYGGFLELITKLTPYNMVDRTRFAWSYWNLFKGWNSKHRTLDPCHNRAKNKNTTRNEKVKPLLFERDLWVAVQRLFTAIEALRRKSIKVHQVIKDYESEVYKALEELLLIWEKLPERVHPYNQSDWKHVGKRYGRKQYVLKETN